MENLSGKVVLITGGTTGIGRATAVLLAEQGVNVYIFGRHEQILEDALSDIKRLSGFEAHGFTADVTDLTKLSLIFETIKREEGRLDILINNAGVGGRSVINTSEEDIGYLIDVNLKAYLFCTKFALSIMQDQEGGGHIVNIGSLSAETTDADTDLYVAAKAGVRGFSESLRKLISPMCIKLTLIEPGGAGTDMTNLTPEEQRSEEKEQKLLMAEDIANSILFALLQPKRTEIIKIQLRAHRQII